MENIDWHEIIVPDPDCLSGASVGRFLANIVDAAGIRWGLADDLIGAFTGLKGQELVPLAIADFLSRAANAVQYDWAFFFLYEEKPFPALPDATDRHMIASAKVTLRLFDNMDFFVYCRDEVLTAHLLRLHPSAQHRKCQFEELSVPY